VKNGVQILDVISCKKLDIKLTFEMLAKCLLIDSSVGSASQAPKIFIRL